MDGVVAYGPKLNVTLNFPEFFEVITDTVFNEEQSECGEIFADAFIQIDELVTAGEGEKLQQIFNLYEPVDTSNPLDVGSVFSAFTNILATQFIASE